MIHIEQAGLRATVQDAGRSGHHRAGVPRSGPADPFAFRAAQALVGNRADDAAIEIVGLPFTFRLADARLVAVTGREVRLVARDALSGWSSVFARDGQLVTVTGTERTRYAYLAVSGGITTPAVLGSRSAYPPAGLGRIVRSGDALPLGPARVDATRAGRVVRYEYGTTIRAVAGPHTDRFDDPDALFAASFVVSARSDRQGVRLEGAPLAPRAGEILTCGVIAGAVQVPRGGNPIVLLADHQTTGGYPIIATVIESDLGRVSQTTPGEQVRFRPVGVAEAGQAHVDLERELTSLLRA